MAAILFFDPHDTIGCGLPLWGGTWNPSIQSPIYRNRALHLPKAMGLLSIFTCFPREEAAQYYNLCPLPPSCSSFLTVFLIDLILLTPVAQLLACHLLICQQQKQIYISTLCRSLLICFFHQLIGYILINLTFLFILQIIMQFLMIRSLNLTALVQYFLDG